MYSFIRNEREKRARERDTQGQEKSFRKKFWAFSKKAVGGLLGQEQGKPTFSRDFANEWYQLCPKRRPEAPLVKMVFSMDI